jgi:hypothetical protein
MATCTLDTRSYAATLPSPAEIRQLAAEIRRGWSHEERQRRREMAVSLQSRLLRRRLCA